MLYVEIAETPSQLHTGLMFRKSLGDNSGMLFKFSNPQILNFWGYNTLLPLDIAFVDQNHKIVKIDSIAPLSKKTISSDAKCLMAIEANAGFFEKNKIHIGDTVSVEKDNIGHIVFFEKNKG